MWNNTIVFSFFCNLTYVFIYLFIYLAISCSSAVAVDNNQFDINNADTNKTDTNKADINKNDPYGISCDSFVVRKDVVQRNQSLSEILLAYNVPYSVIHTLAEKSKTVFDVRKIRAGNPYAIIGKPGKALDVRYFVYEQNPVEFVVFETDSSPDVYSRKRHVEIRKRSAAGIIRSSLYNALLEQDLDYELFANLSELYAWTLDFYHLKKGDRFKVVFEEEMLDGKPIGLGKVLAANFFHNDRNYYAFYFNANGVENYYDENGMGLKKAFLKAPLKYSRITSGYSKSRLHPILDTYKPHLGIDYAAPKGTPIMAIGDGVVEKVGYAKHGGNSIKIKHNSIYTSQYFHMSKYKKGIKSGKAVRQGDTIGYVGSTGLATGPHLDFRLWKNGKAVNFITENIPRVGPVSEEYSHLYYAKINPLRHAIDKIVFDDTSEAIAHKCSSDSSCDENTPSEAGKQLTALSK